MENVEEGEVISIQMREAAFCIASFLGAPIRQGNERAVAVVWSRKADCQQRRFAEFLRSDENVGHRKHGGDGQHLVAALKLGPGMWSQVHARLLSEC